MDKVLNYYYYYFTILLVLLNLKSVKAIINVYEYNEERDVCLQVEKLDISLDLKFINYNRDSQAIIGVKDETRLIQIDLEKNLTKEIWVNFC
jgi:hypothetical protein